MNPAAEPPGPTGYLIIDTNVVLDGWVFGNPAWSAMAEAVQALGWQWMLSAAMWRELGWVLERPMPARFEARRQLALSAWQAGEGPLPCTVLADSDLAAPMPMQRLRCKDRSDQMFLDLAWQLAQTHAATGRPIRLISRDKAVLKLHRRAALEGVAILLPEAWPAAL